MINLSSLMKECEKVALEIMSLKDQKICRHDLMILIAIKELLEALEEHQFAHSQKLN